MSRISFNLRTWRTPTGPLAVVVLIMVATTMAYAQTNLQATLALRPLTAGEIATYGLPATTESSIGLTTVGIGQAAYLEAQVGISVAASDISGVTWTLNR